MSDLDDKARAAVKPLRDLIHESCYQREAHLERQLAEAQAVLSSQHYGDPTYDSLRRRVESAERERDALQATLEQVREVLEPWAFKHRIIHEGGEAPYCGTCNIYIKAKVCPNEIRLRAALDAKVKP